MAKSEEGEFELILGNRQLISVFLIVVVLLGVFFSMGYIVGRNSTAPAAEASRNAAKTAAAETASTDAPASSSATAPNTQEQAGPPAELPKEQIPPAVTHPEQPPPSKPAPVKTAPVKPAPVTPAAVKPAPVKPAPVTPVKPKPTAVGPATVSSEIPTGDYWQVVATSRPDAEIIAEALTKKGFHSLVAPGPREGIFRVLVGPFKDSSTQAQTRTSLEAAGFKNPIVRKY